MRTPIIIGNGTNTAVNLNNPISILRADYILITSPLIAKNLIIYGDGTTLTLSESVNVTSALIDDSVLVSGSRSIISTEDLTVQGPVDGDSGAGADDLSLTVGASLRLNGAVGSISANGLRDLTISAGGNVEFSSTVNLDGDLNLSALGSVLFNGDVMVDGDLIIDATSAVTFSGSLHVGGRLIIRNTGDVTLAGPLTVAGASFLGTSAAPLGALVFASTATVADLSAYASSVNSAANLIAGVLHLEVSGRISLSGPANSVSSARLLSTASSGSIVLASLAVGFSGAEIAANQIDLRGPVTASSSAATLILRPYDSGRAIAVGSSVLGAPASALRIDSTDINSIRTGFASITVGDAIAGTGTVYVGRLGLAVNDATFSSPVLLAGGSIVVTRNIDLDTRVSDLVMVARTGSITINGTVNADTASGRIHFQAAGNISVNRTLRSSVAITFVAGGSVSINLISSEVTAPIIAFVASTLTAISDGQNILTFSEPLTFENRLSAVLPEESVTDPDPVPTPAPESPSLPIYMVTSYQLGLWLLRGISTSWILPYFPTYELTFQFTRSDTSAPVNSSASALLFSVTSEQDDGLRSPSPLSEVPSRAITIDRTIASCSTGIELNGGLVALVSIH